MLRRLVRGYYSLRYFPRRLFAALTQLSLQMNALEQGRAEAFRQGSATLADIEAGIGAFCDDATRAMLGLDRSIAAASGRMSQVHRALMRAEAAKHEGGGTLDEVRKTLEEVCAQTSSMRVGLNRLARAPSASTPAAKAFAAMLDVIAVSGANSAQPGAAAATRQRVTGFEGVRAAVSVGLANDVRWDVDVASHGIPVLQFDPTISTPSVSGPLFTFERIAVVGAEAVNGLTLQSLLESRVPPGSGALILKLDMDLCDWGVIGDADELVLGRFQSVVLQFHQLERLDDEASKAAASAALRRLAKTHLIEHARANGCVDLLNDDDAMTPSSAEIRLRLKDGLPLPADAQTSTMARSYLNERHDEPTHFQNSVTVHDAVPAA